MNINPNTNSALKLLLDGSLALCRAEQAGIRVDEQAAEKQKLYLTKKINQIESTFKTTDFYKEWRQSVGGKSINIDSHPQLSKFLYGVKKLKAKTTTTKGKDSTNEDSLLQLGIPELGDLVEKWKLMKIRDTYLDAFVREAVNGYMHPSFGLHLVKSFRSSSNSPNFQNIPARDEEAANICRGVLFPHEGHMLMESDFKSVEVAVNSCLVGSTKVETIDGSQSLLKIIRRLNKKEKVYVYGYNQDKQRICVAEVTKGKLTKEKAEVWKVTLDNNEIVTATPDHKFMLRNGDYVELKNLQTGNSLMPFYKTNKKSSYGTVYEKIYLNNGKSILAHNLIAEDVRGVKIAGSNKLVHHKYGNGCDNSLANTEVMTRKKHMRIHSIQGWIKRPSSERESWFSTPAGRDFIRKQSKERKENWDSKKWEEIGNRISESIKNNGGNKGEKNPMFGKKQSEKSKEKNRQTHLGKQAWNKGLTKETDDRIKQYGLSISLAKKGKHSKNERKKGEYAVSEATKEKLRIVGLNKPPVSEITKERLKKAWGKRKEKGKTVECKICNQKFISLSHLHLKNIHNITPEEYKKTYNHKVVSIEFAGYSDVYNLNVEGIHNYALSSGVIVKNCINKDPVLTAYVRDPSTDMHRDMAMQIFKLDSFDKKQDAHNTLRQAAKGAFVFAEFYGDYWLNVTNNLTSNWCKLPKGKWREGMGIAMPEGTIGDHLISKGIKSYAAFEKHIQAVEQDFWGNRFKEYARWKDKFWKSYQKKGYIDLPTGFRCSGLMDKKQVCNYPGQGSAFHVLLRSFILMDELITLEKLNSRLIGQVHDSMVLSVDPDEKDHIIKSIKHITTVQVPEEWPWIIVPLSVELKVGKVNGPWSDMSKI